MGCRSSTRGRSRPESTISATHGPIDRGFSRPHIECPEQEQGNEAPSRPEGQPLDAPSFSGSAAHPDEDEEMIITSIRATDISLGLQRIPAGFYVVVLHSNLEWKTEIQSVLVNNDVVEWHEQIQLPCSLSATISFGIRASFEFQPVLGSGEDLQTLATSTDELLDRSGRGLPFTFQERGDVISPCSSLLVTAARRKRESISLSDPGSVQCLVADYQGQLEDATNQGHRALSRYRKQGELRDLELSIEKFEHALDVCPPDHPCRAAAQSNLAIAKLICYRVYSIGSLDVPLTLYRDALDTRPIGHPDRPSTLIQLASVHLVQFEKQQHEVDAAQIGALLREVIDINSAESHEHRAAIFMLELHAQCTTGVVRAGALSSMKRESTTGLADMDPSDLSLQLLHRFEKFGDLADLQRAISILEAFITSCSSSDNRHLVAVMNLGAALKCRFDHFGKVTDLGEAISRHQDALDIIPDCHPDKLKLLNNLCHCYLTRFEHLRELGDLRDAISRQQEAVDLTPHSHPDKPGLLATLGNCYFTRSNYRGELNDLQESISWQEQAVDLTPDDHPDRPLFLNILGNFFRTRFEHLRELGDLEESILRQQVAINLTPDGHPEKPRFLTNLGISYITRFNHIGKLSDLQDAISAQRDALDLTPHGHSDKPIRLVNLGIALATRFERFGGLSDLEDAISRQKEAVDLTPHGHPDKPSFLNNLSNSFFIRFKRLEELSDLEAAISVQQDVLDLTPCSHPDKSARLANLGSFLVTRFQHRGDLSDLEEAICKQQDVVDLTPHDHVAKPARLNNLGISLVTRFEYLGRLSDLEGAISRQQDALNTIPHDHPDQPNLLNNLSNSFFTRFNHIGELIDLEEAISRQRYAVDLTPHDHPDRANRLANLGNYLAARFERLGDLSNLQDAISKQQNAVDLTPRGHPHKPLFLKYIGSSFFTRFNRLGELSDLEAAIARQQDALDLTPHSHPDKPNRLSNLGNLLVTRFERLGELSDLEDTISKQQDALNITPHGHPDKPRFLNNLGNSYLIRFKHIGELNDLEEAILKQRGAVDLTPHGHPDKATRLASLGNSFAIRFERFGALGNLEDAISRQRDAVDLTPHNHPDKPTFLNSLAMSFSTRFERFGEPNHPNKPPFVSNLGNLFVTRFKHFGELGDLENAILRQCDAVDLAPRGHLRKPGFLNNLGNSYLTRFDTLGDLNDLENAIARYRDAVDLTPHGQSDKPKLLANLGIALATRFKHIGDLSDLEDALLKRHDAVDLTPDGHPHKPDYLGDLAGSLLTRHQRLGEPSDLEYALSLFSHAACAFTGSVAVRFRASLRWIFCARRLRHHSLLSACSVAVSLLPQLSWIGLSLAHRYRELSQGSDVVREAAAVALDFGHLETAVEWLEQGRAIIWGELLQMRSPHDDLSSAHPDLARRLRELSVALEHASATREKSLSSRSEQTHSLEHLTTESLQRVADRHRALAIERDNLLQDIRRLPGFERFLLHKEFSQLRASAHSGPVVILNAAERRCDALIILAGVDHVVHVPLPSFVFEKSKGFLKSLVHARAIPRDGRYGRPVEQDVGKWKPILSFLWKCVVKPVLDTLAFTTPGDLSRIFWCPTGPFTFLPIHAAGFYYSRSSEPGHKVFDFVVSSYIPSLSILVSPRKPETAPCNGLRLLVVHQPPSDGQIPLPGVKVELEKIRAVIQNSPFARTTLVECSTGTVEEVLALMKEADWVHFACHGVQDDSNPTESGLCLADRRRLRVSDVIALSRPCGGLAFLSACQTARGDEDLSDEIIHVAAGMLFAGYGGVVGTMWSISDRLAPDVARGIYEELFRNGTTPDYRDAAQALHVVVERLRGSNVPFEDWLPFIHVGL